MKKQSKSERAELRRLARKLGRKSRKNVRYVRVSPQRAEQLKRLSEKTTKFIDARKKLADALGIDEGMAASLGLGKRKISKRSKRNQFPGLGSIGAGILGGAEWGAGEAAFSHLTKKGKKSVSKKKKKKAKKARRPQAGKIVRRNLEGYLDASGEFHPIRGTEGYSPRLGGDVRMTKKQVKRAKKRLGRRNPTHALGLGRRCVSVGTKAQVNHDAKLLRLAGKNPRIKKIPRAYR